MSLSDPFGRGRRRCLSLCLSDQGEKVEALTAAAMDGRVSFEESLRLRVKFIQGLTVYVQRKVACSGPDGPGLKLGFFSLCSYETFFSLCSDKTFKTRRRRSG